MTQPARHGEAKKKWDPNAKGPNGRPLCAWCGKEVPPGRRRWCSEACVNEYLITSSGSSARRAVFERDEGVCAICGVDCARLERVLRRLWHRARRDKSEERDRSNWWIEARNKWLWVQKRLEGMRSFWEADHMRAVSEGGGSCGLDNLRTLCIGCHRQETHDLRRRKATKNWKVEEYLLDQYHRRAVVEFGPFVKGDRKSGSWGLKIIIKGRVFQCGVPTQMAGPLRNYFQELEKEA